MDQNGLFQLWELKKKECRTSLLKWCILGQALVKSQESCYLLWFSIFLVASNNKGQNEIWWCYSWKLDKIPAWRCWGIQSKPKPGLVKTWSVICSLNLDQVFLKVTLWWQNASWASGAGGTWLVNLIGNVFSEVNAGWVPLLLLKFSLWDGGIVRSRSQDWITTVWRVPKPSYYLHSPNPH